MTEINPNITPGSVYTPQGVNHVSGNVSGVSSSNLKSDQISVSRTSSSQKSPPPTASNARIPPPTNQNQEPQEGTIKANPWLSTPNIMAQFFLVMLAYQKNMSTQRFTESQMKLTLSNATFNLGMDNANLAKKLKTLEADKQYLEAMGSFANAAVSAGAIGMVAGSRKQTTAQTDNSEVGQAKNKEKAKMDELENQLFRSKSTSMSGAADSTPEAAHASGARFANEEDLMAAPGNDPDKQRYMAQKDKLAKAQSDYDREFHNNLTANQAMERHASDALQNVVSGTVKLISAGITEEQGAVEQLKASNETMLQYWSRLIDNVSKSKEDQLAEINQVRQMITQFSSETRVRLSSH